MGRLNCLINGVLLGAGTMYFFDPQLGRRRRALLEDQLRRFSRQASEGLDAAIRDLNNRAQGTAVEMQHLFSREEIPDEVLRERIRSLAGRYLSNASALRVDVHRGHVRLSGPVLADINMGKVTRWNDPAIAALNPGATLPATEITSVYRSDGSGDTYAFSDFLSKVSPEWKSKKGTSTQVNFTVGIGGRGNDGVTAALDRDDGTIGYLAISYVFSNNLAYALIRNESGTSIPPDNKISITNPPASAAGAYPISTFTYALVPRSSDKAKTLRDFLTYAIGDGQSFGAKLHFAPLPARVVEAGKKTLAKIG